MRAPEHAARVLAYWWIALLWTPPIMAAVEPPLAAVDAPLRITADHGSQWQEGQYDVWLLSGRVQIQQDDVRSQSGEAVLWVDRGAPSQGIPSKVIVYLETDVVIDFQRSQARIEDRTWLGRFHTREGIDLHVTGQAPHPPQEPPVVRRGRQARADEARQTTLPTQTNPIQATQFAAPLETIPPPPAATALPSARNVRITPRSSIRMQAESFPSPDPNETIIAITSGVRVLISGIQNVPGVEGNLVTLEADRVVVWTDALSNLSFSSESISQGGSAGRWEFYLEGNIVFREGDRVIYADRMYYDVLRNQGVILNAEALTPVDDYEGLLRLKADVLHQLDQQSFLAYGAALTSSRLGVPRYWFQADTITFNDFQQPRIDPFTGQVALDPQTGEVAVDHELQATSRNNFLYVGGFPVLYWPVMATDLTKPTFYLDRIRLKNDSVFGTQVLADLDVYQLLGWGPPAPGTKWTVSTDYLSERGFGLGTNFRYESNTLFALPGPYQGFLDAWGIHDNGLDNLGADRLGVPLEEDFRGRVLWQHRHQLGSGFQFTGELGLVSDRNFLEQYYENEWDEQKDATTGVELKRYVGNSTWSVTSDVRLNDFYTQTEWLPRFNHVLLGQSLLGDRLTWHGHSHVGYAKLRVGDAPTNPVDRRKYDPLAWEAEREGLYAGTRQELDLPLQAGPVKIVPYVLGEMFRVGEDLQGQQRTRALGQAGVRASLPLWRAEPAIQSYLLNLNGLAHKVSVDAEFLWADADENVDQFPMYEPLDDDAVEFFRRRFFFDTFGGTAGGDVPLRFDERTYALRSGMQRSVTAPNSSIADDLTLVKLGLRQRWQTRRGLPGQERIIDWMVLDVEGSLFPDADRDNFGEEFGLFDYNFRWHLGDRLTFLSDGYADFFGDGLRTFTVGGMITRPERGNLYLGVRSIEGPISSNILGGSVSYRMTEKWIFTAGASVDLGPVGNIGQSLGLTRIGESALVRIGFNVDSSRDNIGVSFAIEPRFLPSNRLGRVAGVQIPPAGAYGLE